MNFDEIVVKESPGLCRCCLSEGCYKDLGSEYTWMNETEVYAEMLLDCFDIGITQHSDGPNGAKRLICEVCITRLRDACNFKKQVLDSEKRFIDMLGRGEFRPKVLIYQQQDQDLKEESEEPTDMDLAEDVEYLEDLDYGGDEEVIKSEDVQSTSLPTTSEDADRPKLKRGRPKKEEDKSEKGKAKKAKAAKDCTLDHSDVAERRSNNMKIIFNHTTIIPFKWETNYMCYYCDENHTEYTKLRNHTLSHRPCTRKTLEQLPTFSELKIDVSEIRCELCQTKFESVALVVDHLIKRHCQVYDKTVNIPFEEYRLCDLTCHWCDKQYRSFKILSNHVKSFHLKNRFECKDCRRLFKSAESLTLHLKIHHSCEPSFDEDPSERDSPRGRRHRRTQQCTSCGMEFMHMRYLKKHIAVEHPSEGCIKCCFCSEKFSSAVELQIHLSDCEAKRLDIYGTNGVKRPKKRNRKDHCEQIRRNIQCVLNMSTAVPFKFKGKFFCFYCPLWFLDFEDLISHTQVEHPVCDLNSKSMRSCKGDKTCVKVDINNLSCKLCTKPMSDLESFINHAIAEHGADYDKSIPLKDCVEAFHIIQGKIPCPICKEPFTYFATLLKHLGLAHNQHKAVCAYCGHGFRNGTSLTMHIINSHTGTRECTVCHVKCQNTAVLSRHMARYHDAKDHKCPQCSEEFNTVYMKQIHLIQAHNVGHKCEYCGKMFTKNSFMIYHVRRTHLKERTVPCSICHIKFFDKTHLKNHMVKHEGVRKFRCVQCGKDFLRKKNLICHLGTHKKLAD